MNRQIWAVFLFRFWYRLLDDKIVHIVTAFLKKRALQSTPSSLIWQVTGTKVAADIVIFDPPYLVTFFMSTGRTFLFL